MLVNSYGSKIILDYTKQIDRSADSLLLVQQSVKVNLTSCDDDNVEITTFDGPLYLYKDVFNFIKVILIDKNKEGSDIYKILRISDRRHNEESGVIYVEVGKIEPVLLEITEELLLTIRFSDITQFKDFIEIIEDNNK